ncbi:MAG: HU family DNA-binding protein [Bacteroidales bacterium]
MEKKMFFFWLFGKKSLISLRITEVGIMKNKELIQELSIRLNWAQKEVSEVLEGFGATIGSRLADGDTIHLEGLGEFEAQKKEERISVNPTDGKRYLIPPKLVPVFKPDATVKAKLKELGANE